jgi:hypothetical protein
VAISDQAIELRREVGDPTSTGNTLLLASKINWFKGNRDSALELAREAVSVLESIGGEDLAMAYSTLSRWAMVNSDLDQTLHYAEKALAQLDNGASPARAHTLINRGTMIAEVDLPRGPRRPRRGIPDGHRAWSTGRPDACRPQHRGGGTVCPRCPPCPTVAREVVSARRRSRDARHEGGALVETCFDRCDDGELGQCRDDSPVGTG